MSRGGLCRGIHIIGAGSSFGPVTSYVYVGYMAWASVTSNSD